MQTVPAITAILAMPQVVRLDSQHIAEDPTLRAFVEQANAAFYLIHLACLFDASWLRPVRGATIAVPLSDPLADSPLAWSMSPLSERDEVEASSGVKLGVDLKVATASLETSHERRRRRPTLMAYGELTSEPTWQLTRRPSQPILGSRRFILVLRAHPRGNPQVEVKLSYRAFRQTLDEKRPISVTLPLRSLP
jgi:hypothetical protein